MRQKGIITSWNDDRGFGFISPLDGGARVFVHIKVLGNRSNRPQVNDVVTYSVTKDSNGRTQAANVTGPGDNLRVRSSRQTNLFAIRFAVFFLVVLGVTTYAEKTPVVVLSAYLIISMITYCAYAWDKASAKSGRWRTKENTLHLCALVGGWPGALIAQQLLRHKSRKTSFRVFLWFTILLNCTGLVWLHTADGSAYLSRLLESIAWESVFH
ncbi:MAG: cold shock and DUF1294 domain-containing protein [Gammaproteobacteria bacterium]|nr:cold shock and DUF1294 domain-containing protein [Gammaproteobacteria bacterium]